MAEITFPIEALRGAPSSRTVLNGLKTRCSRMPEIKLLCERLLERLEYLHPHVAPISSADPSKKRYVQVVVDFIKMLRHSPLLVRLANSETFVRNIKYYQQKLDGVQIALGLEGEPRMTLWIQEWKRDVSAQFPELNDRVTRAAERMLVNEVSSDKKLEDALMTLESSLNWSGLADEMRELKRATFERVSLYANKTGLTMFDWFIPVDCLHYGEIIGEVGTLGSVSKATWTCGGDNGEDITKEVVVKQLFPEISASSDEAFLKQLRLWSSVKGDSHVLKMYGGNHVSNPQFYVCEYAPNGNLVEFLGKNPGMFWQMFYRAAEGLQYLHSQDPPIIHGGLKCSNILVGADYSAKLTDFGFASVRSLSGGLSGRAAEATMNAIRWKPKEVVEEVGNEQPMFESDIYSMGMCMVEALTQALPYEMDDEQTVMDKVLSGGLPDRPDDVEEDTWEIITRLCNQDPARRPALNEVLKIFRLRAAEEMTVGEFSLETKRTATVAVASRVTGSEKEIGTNDPTLPEVNAIESPADEKMLSREESNVATATVNTCASCTKQRTVGDEWCRWCGYSLRGSVSGVTRHCLAKTLPNLSSKEAWLKAYELVTAVKALHEDGIVHADLKPANILIGRDGKARLAGFEHSLHVEQSPDPLALRCADRLRWHAPEYLAGDALSLASDVYSAAMCIIYVVSREPPWGANLSDEQVLSQRALPPRRSTAFTDSEWELIQGMCAVNPKERISIDAAALRMKAIASVDTDTMPEWRMDLEVSYVSTGSFSTAAFASRHVGRWKDAAVVVEEPTRAFSSLGRELKSVAELWFSLRHPTVHPLFGACQANDQQMLVCEYATHDLASFITDSRPSDTKLWQILLDAALAIRYLHAVGIIHGDVSLSNILVGQDGRGKLSGFWQSSKGKSNLEGEPTDDDDREEWTARSCELGHCPAFCTDVYQLGKCINDIFSGSMTTTGARCDVCDACAISQLDIFSDEEWKLVSAMCCFDRAKRIEMPEVVGRLARIVAANNTLERARPWKPAQQNEERKVAQMRLIDQMRRFEVEMSDTSDEEEELDIGYQGLTERRHVMKEDIAEDLADDAAKESWIESCGQLEDVSNKEKAICFRLRKHWCIPHVGIAERKRNSYIDKGVSASVYQGMWLGAPVALKRMKKIDTAQRHTLTDKAKSPAEEERYLRVKLKVADLEQSQVFHEEANNWICLRHPHILSLYGACTSGYRLLVCELVDNNRLDMCFKNSLDDETIWGVLHDAAVGLQGLHLHGVVHADLKCDNIMITRDGRAKLIDFGLSCLRECDGGIPLGAMKWKAPECLRGDRPSFESDIYSFGMCIIEAFSGEYPWGTKTEDTLVTSSVQAGKLPNPPARFDHAQRKLLEHMCCPDPKKRLGLDDVVRIVGLFAKRPPYIDDSALRRDFPWLADLDRLQVLLSFYGIVAIVVWALEILAESI